MIDVPKQNEFKGPMFDTELQIISAQQQHNTHQEGNDWSLAGGHG